MSPHLEAPLTQHDTRHRYKCFNTKRGGPLTAPANIHPVDLDAASCVSVKHHIITHWFDPPCAHDLRMSDPCCTDCVNRDVEP